MQAGVETLKREIAYLSYRDEPKEHDMLVILKLNEDGSVKSPAEAVDEYEIVKVIPRESDFGRIEYYLCVIEKVK
jgi:hypothetical protein